MLCLALSAASASLVHCHAVLGGPRDRHRALTRMEESEDARPLMEPARNVISSDRRSHTVRTASCSAEHWPLPGDLWLAWGARSCSAAALTCTARASAPASTATASAAPARRTRGGTPSASRPPRSSSPYRRPWATRCTRPCPSTASLACGQATAGACARAGRRRDSTSRLQPHAVEAATI
eukprot:scaffold37720_cov67-Phaeocystis_antarctica.AAC.9